MKKHARFIAAVIIIAATIAAFFLRTGSFKKQRPLTFDEYVYSVLGLQLSKNPFIYSTEWIYKDERKKGRKLPNYFRAPLFKHPPFFPYLIAGSCKLFGPTFYSAFKVSLLFGALLIPLAYLLTITLFDDRITALSAAFLMSIEPISMIVSQKIWMESTLAFFILLSLYLFIRAVKKYNPILMIAGGIAVGCAALTKYPGIFALAVILLYTVCYERPLLKKKAFWMSLCVPLIMLGLWFFWNYKIYGATFFAAISGMHKLHRLLRTPSQHYLFAAMFLIAAATALILVLKHSKIKTALIFACGLALLAITHKHSINAFIVTHVPAAGWKMSMFSLEPWYFYIGRMIELSPFYIFSLICIFLFAVDTAHGKAYAFLCLSVSVYLIFYVWWRNYQSRYVTCLTVPLMILSAAALRFLWNKTERIPEGPLRMLARVSFSLLVIFSIVKTIRIDMLLAVPNNVCYF